MPDRHIQLSRALSHMLRHRPDLYGIALDEAGWAPIDSVIAALARHKPHWRDLSPDDIDAMMAVAEKQRFEVDGARIRARYGHSVEGRIAHRPARPPALLYHGTTRAALASIRKNGLRPMRRQFVHLSPDTETAIKVAGRRTADPVIIEIDAESAHRSGLQFHHAGDRTWLAEAVDPIYLTIPD